MCILERLGPYAGTYFQNDLYGSKSYQCLPDFTVGGAKCPEGAQNMNDCDIDDYARHGNFDYFLLFSTGHFWQVNFGSAVIRTDSEGWSQKRSKCEIIFLGGNCLKQYSSIFIYCSEYFDPSGLSDGNIIDSSYVDYTCSRNRVENDHRRNCNTVILTLQLSLHPRDFFETSVE